MRLRFCVVVPLLFSLFPAVRAQTPFSAVVVDSATRAPIVGAIVVVVGTNYGGVTDTMGKATIARIPDGRHTIVFSHIGFESRDLVLDFPLAEAAQPIEITLVSANVELEGVTVTSARTSYHLYNAPLRIEVKGEEDIGETMIDHPSSISELFLESTGMQVLQTSPVSNHVSIKLQGLDGSYTQILKDGFPLFGGLSADLSVTQIPPLDLNRVEIIKGPSSSLYGAGAIAGIINLISQRPSQAGQCTVLLNGASSRGIDAGLFLSAQRDRVGYTLLFNGNASRAYDGDGSGFSDVPQQLLFTLNPKLFYDLNDRTAIMVGLSTTSEDLSGGDMAGVTHGASSLHPYVERIRSNRSYTQLEVTSSMAGASLAFKNSIGYFYLNRSLASNHVEGTQWSSFSELSAQTKTDRHTITGGLNLTTERFLENPGASGMDRSYTQWTAGMFGQDDWQIVPPFTLETGLRLDQAHHYGWQIIPRIAGIYRIDNNVGLRASAGLG
jgi:outer membrane receptor for ferrienterochelin and colicins